MNLIFLKKKVYREKHTRKVCKGSNPELGRTAVIPKTKEHKVPITQPKQ